MLLLVAVVGWQGFTARTALVDAQHAAGTLKRQLASGDIDAARRTAGELRADAERARDRTDGLVWRGLGHLPVVGGTFSAVSTTAAALERVADQTLPPSLDLAHTLGELQVDDGSVPLGPLERHAGAIAEGADAAALADERVGAIDPESVLEPVRHTFVAAQEQLHDVHTAAQAAATATKLLPAMLGSEGPRRYLLVFQNNAESRSTGGIFGSWAILTAVDGTLSLGMQGGAGDIPRLKQPVLPLQPDEVSVYGDQLGTLFQDLNFTPDFPRSAAMAAAMLQRRPAPSVDGVISLDPVALSYLLKATGPVDVRMGEVHERLTAANAVDILLNKIYRTQPPDVQDEFFAAAARQVFAKVTSGAAAPLDLVHALVRGAAEGRVLVWSRHPGEERRLIDTRVGGDLPHDPDGPPQVGVYLNDATASKMEYYLDLDTELRARQCTARQTQRLALSVTMTSTAPPNAASLPPSVVGPGIYAPQGTMRNNLRIYGPVDGRITSLRVDGQSVAITSNTHDDRQVAILPISLQPGETAHVEATMRSGPGQGGDPVLSTTPTAHPGPTRWQVPTACE